jgi:predicted small lipoprotein YifL
MTKHKTVIVMFLSLVLVFAMTACGSKPEPENETQTDTGQETAENSDDYDIASNLQLAGGGDEKALDTDHFTVELTHGSSWDYTVDSKTSITIYNVAAREANCGGRLVSIKAYDPADKDYEMLPSYSVIGEKNGKLYIAEYPSDVQFDPTDEQAAEDYQAVFEEVNRIREGAADSPLVLK